MSKSNIRDFAIIYVDKNGFMMAIHNFDSKKELDLILHTEGVDIAATESIVNYLNQRFDDNIIAIIAQITMSRRNNDRMLLQNSTNG